jgi:hypothetical protein
VRNKKRRDIGDSDGLEEGKLIYNPHRYKQCGMDKMVNGGLIKQEIAVGKYVRNPFNCHKGTHQTL